MGGPLVGVCSFLAKASGAVDTRRGVPGVDQEMLLEVLPVHSIKSQFHLSLGVKSIEASVHFFESALKATVEHRDPSGYVNINFFGTQITLKEDPGANADIPNFHFGVNLAIGEFELLAKNILELHRGSLVTEPKVVDPGTSLERRKMYVRCPTGYLIEIKGYREG